MQSTEHRIIATLSSQLVSDYGKGFSTSALTRMVKFAEAFPIRVAEYLAHIPDMEMLQAQLHRVVALARERVAQAALPHE